MILITGAGGYLGRHVVAAAHAAGHSVRAHLRKPAPAPPAWPNDPAIDVAALDLSHADPAALAALLSDVDVVIHTAAAMQGGDGVHRRDTVDATAALLKAMEGSAARLVLSGSLSVYNYASLPAGATIEEFCALEPETARRDAYCRAKLSQERMVTAAVQTRGLQARIMRIGLLHDDDSGWFPALGLRIGRTAFSPAKPAALPLVHVADAAQALLAAATASPPCASDVRVVDGAGWLEILNVVGDAQPTGRAWLGSRSEACGIDRIWPLPLMPLRLIGTTTSFMPNTVDGAIRRLPGLFRRETLEARFKPLHYSNARIRARLGWRPGHGLDRETAATS